MKEKVLALLQDNATIPEEKYNTAMDLYRKTNGSTGAAVNFYNRSGFTKGNLDNLLYDLQKLHGISDAEKASAPVVAQAKGIKVDAPKVEKVDPKIANQENVTLDTVFTQAPDDVKTGIKLIEEFPFLDDADCPDKLKILVQDKFTAWRNYQKAHAALLVTEGTGEAPVPMTNEEIFELAKIAVENFKLNDAIKAELKYYGEHKQILGNHPIFADEVMIENVKALTMAKAVARRNNLRSYISRDTPKVEQAKNEKSALKIKEKLQVWNQELNLLNEKIGE